jgi:hypothetical protein
MAFTIGSDPKWLQHLLELSISEGWCMRINCGTCASEQLRQALGLLNQSSSSQPRFLPMTAEIAEVIVDGLKVCKPSTDINCQFEEGARWVLYEVWRNFGDRYFPKLNGTWANEVLVRMRSHYQQRQEARRIHQARQGVKMRDWTE